MLSWENKIKTQQTSKEAHKITDRQTCISSNYYSKPVYENWYLVNTEIGQS